MQRHSSEYFNVCINGQRRRVGLEEASSITYTSEALSVDFAKGLIQFPLQTARPISDWKLGSAFAKRVVGMLMGHVDQIISAERAAGILHIRFVNIGTYRNAIFAIRKSFPLHDFDLRISTHGSRETGLIGPSYALRRGPESPCLVAILPIASSLND